MPSIKKKYKYPDDFYCRRFNISSSSVFRYKKEGAPLDDDAKFEKWISQRSYKPKAFQRPRQERVESIRRKVMAGGPEGLPAAPQLTGRALITGTGLRVEIARQEAECAEAYRRYREALDLDSALDASAFHKIWTAAQKSLRELSKDVPKSETDDAKVLPVVDIETAWRRSLGEMKTMLENVPATVALGLTGVSTEVRVQVEQSMMDEIVSVINSLRESPWIK